MKPALLALFFLVNCGSHAQLKPIMLSEVTIWADRYCGSDNFDFYYGITEQNTFTKGKGEKLLEYQNLSLGKLTKVDLQNPLQLVLFYENFNTVVMLDSQLNETKRIGFSEGVDTPVIAAVGMASKNQLWFYDSLTQKLGLWDYLNGTSRFITPPLLDGIKAYGSDFNNFKWIDDKRNWFSCDIFGKITALGMVPEFDEIQLSGDLSFVFRKGASLSVYDGTTSKNYQLENIDAVAKSFFLKDKILAIFTGIEIINYKISLP